MKFIALIVLSLLMVPFILSGADYYVSVTGTDSNNGTSQDKPFKTLQKASDRTNPGDTVFVMDGTFVKRNASILTITRSGQPEAYVTYKALPGHHPKILCGGTVWNIILVLANYIIIDGLEVIGDNENITYDQAREVYDYALNAVDKDWNYIATVNTNGISIGDNNVTQRPHHVIIRHCIVHGCPGGGIGTLDVDYITIEDNIIYSNCWYSMYAHSGISLFWNYNYDEYTGYKNFIRRNLCYDNECYIPWYGYDRISDGNGIIVDSNKDTRKPGDTDYVGRTLVENNVSFANGGSGIHAYKCRYVDIVNNTAYHNSRSPALDYAEMFANDCEDARLYNNIMVARDGGAANSNYNNKKTYYNYNIYYNGTTAIAGKYDLKVDPMFVTPSEDPVVADFHLREGSPAIDFGTTELAPADDFDHRPRPQGRGVDKGAYEYVDQTDVGDHPPLVPTVLLAQNYPNPFNPATVLSYQLNKPDYVWLGVFNDLGQQVCILADEFQAAGLHQVIFDGTQFTSGVYFYQLKSGSEKITRKLCKGQ
jgi:hypothetical protein